MFDVKRVKAWEAVDYYYFTQMTKPNWTVTPSTDFNNLKADRFTKYDATVSNGNTTYYVELKGRETELTDTILQEGCAIDKYKVEELEELDKNAFIIQFFYKSNRTFCWNVNNKDGWQLVKRKMRKNNTSQEQIEKEVYLLPFRPENERYVDLTGYYSMFCQHYTSMSDQENNTDKYPFK